MQRGLRQKLLETYPGFEPFIEDFMPKKASLEAVKLYSLPLLFHRLAFPADVIPLAIHALRIFTDRKLTLLPIDPTVLHSTR